MVGAQLVGCDLGQPFWRAAWYFLGQLRLHIMGTSSSVCTYSSKRNSHTGLSETMTRMMEHQKQCGHSSLEELIEKMW